MSDLPAAPEHRDLAPGEEKKLREQAFALGRKIETSQAKVAKEMWILAHHVYDFHEGGCWGLLGYDTLEEYLAQSEVSLKRSQFFRLSKMYRDLHLVKKIPMKTLQNIDPSKAQAIAGPLVRGDVSVEKALADASPGGMGVRDLVEEYGRATNGQKLDDERLDAESVPARVLCEHCGSWYEPRATNGESADA